MQAFYLLYLVLKRRNTHKYMKNKIFNMVFVIFIANAIIRAIIKTPVLKAREYSA